MSTHASIAQASLRLLETPEAAGIERMSTSELRRHFLLEDLFQPGELNLVYTNLDRLIVGGAAPASSISLSGFPELGTEYFTERRELGILNIGGECPVTAGGTRYTLGRLDCLYVGRGEREIVFEPPASGEAALYLASAPAHCRHRTAFLRREEAEVVELGEACHANRRRIIRYIGPGRIESCQLVMGFTEVLEGSVWNTMPPHTHSRRSEIYLYFDMPDGLALHVMGAPEATRHLIVRDRQAVLSPWWSLHMGAGTGPYKFLWAMAGENQEFGDVDPVDFRALM